jgi:hypothetical protein
LPIKTATVEVDPELLQGDIVSFISSNSFDPRFAFDWEVLGDRRVPISLFVKVD